MPRTKGSHNSRDVSVNMENILGHCKNRFLQNYPHHFDPGHNLTNAEFQDTFPYKANTWQSTMPCPLTNPTSTHETKDVCMDLVVRKEEHNKALETIKAAYKRTQQSKELKKLQRMHSEPVHSGFVYKFAKQLEQEPDAYFQGNYDWYFTGGNMKITSQNYLLHTTGHTLDTLNMSKIVEKSGQLTLLSEDVDNISAKLQGGHTLYELRCLRNSDLLLARQKNIISIINLQQLQILNTYESIDGIPFVSAALDRLSGSALTVDAAQNVMVYDVNKNKCIKKGSLKQESHSSLDENWSCLREFSFKTFSYSNRHNLYIFDLRSSIQMEKTKFTYKFDSAIEPCEEITCVEPVPDSTLVYVATSHKLFALDLRFPDHPVTYVRWTHQFESRPNMMDIFVKPNEPGQIVTVGSTRMGEVKVCELFKNRENCWVSPCLPYRPHNIQESFEYTKTQGSCVEPTSRAKQHVRLSASGLALHPVTANNFALFVQNSAGDVFGQEVFRKTATPALQEKIINKEIKRWDKQLMKFATKSYSVTDLLCFESMSNVLRNNLDVQYEDVAEPRRARRNPTWKQPYSEMETYVDALAADMLSVWDMKSEVNNTKENFEKNIEVVGGMDKVSEWLSITTEKTEAAVTSNANEQLQPTPVTTTALPPPGSTYAMEIDSQFDDTLMSLAQTEDAPKTKSVNKKKPPPRRSFVVGF